MKRFVVLCLVALVLLSVFCGCDFSKESSENNTVDNKKLIDAKDGDHSDEIDLTKGDIEGYEFIITMYRHIAELCLNYQDDKEKNGDYVSMYYFADETISNWYNSIFSSTYLLYPRDSDGLSNDGYKCLGYTIKDLNGDKVEELILRLSNDTVIAIFTMVDGIPKLVDCYWNRYSCWIDPDGFLRIHSSNGADYSTDAIYEINNVGELVLLWECGTDGYDESSFETIYYNVASGEKHHITKEEYDDFCDQCPYLRYDKSFENPEHLVFIPLFDDNYIPQCKIDVSEG